MASSTLLYIAWPVTLGLSFMAGGIDLPNESTTEKSKPLNRYSSTISSANENYTAINHRTSIFPRVGKDGYPETYDIKEITKISDPQKRFTAFLGMIDQLGPGDFEQAIADFPNLRSMSKQEIDEYWLFLKTWSKINPEGALTYAKENCTSTFTSGVILRTWAKYAPDAAIKWAKLNHEGDLANSYLVDIIAGISSTNPERATEVLHNLPPGKDRKNALSFAAREISKLGTEKAIAWWATIKDEKLQVEATKALLNPLTRKDPQATIDWLKTHSPKTLNDNAATVASAWPIQDIGKAAEWTNSLEGKTRRTVAQTIIDKFAYSDPLKAVTWIKTMSDEPGYNGLVRRLMDSIVNPEIVLMNLDQFDNDSDRNDYRKKSLTKWAAKDKNAATQWMQSNNIDPATEERILSEAASASP